MWPALLRNEYRKIKRPFPPTSSAPPPATLLPLVPAPGVGPHPARHPPWRAPHQDGPEAPCATGHHPAPQGTDRTGGWGRVAGAAGVAGGDAGCRKALVGVPREK